jgi:hypothetical protein
LEILKILMRLFDNFLQSRMGRLEAGDSVRLGVGIGILDPKQGCRSETNSEKLEAIEKGAPRQSFSVQLILDFIGLPPCIAIVVHLSPPSSRWMCLTCTSWKAFSYSYALRLRTRRDDSELQLKGSVQLPMHHRTLRFEGQIASF